MIFSIYEITNSDEYKYENFIRNDVLDTDFYSFEKNDNSVFQKIKTTYILKMLGFL